MALTRPATTAAAVPGGGSAASLVVPAPAKLNLFLHVTGRRPDGYHTLESLFVALDFGDTVTLTRRDDGAIVRTADVPGVPAEADLAVRAARALQRATGTPFGVEIAVDKRIPAGGGLGGGSSDAASVLLALNRLWGLGLDRAALMEIGLALGADVPVLRLRRAGARARRRRAADGAVAAAVLGRGRRAPGERADRDDLRRAGIDTRGAVGENGSLFRRLWPE